MIRPWHWDPGRDHVRVTNRFDFLEAMFFEQRIKGTKELVKQKDYLVRRDVSGERREASEVRDQNAGFWIFIGDGDFALFHSPRNGFREWLEGEAVGFFAFGLVLSQTGVGMGGNGDPP